MRVWVGERGARGGGGGHLAGESGATDHSLLATGHSLLATYYRLRTTCLADEGDVGGALHEGGGDEVDAALDAKVLQVGVGER